MLKGVLIIIGICMLSLILAIMFEKIGEIGAKMGVKYYIKNLNDEYGNLDLDEMLKEVD